MPDFLRGAALLSESILALGDPRFAQTLIEAISTLVPVDHLAIVVFDDQFIGRLASAASRQPGNAALKAGRLYEQARFYRHDPGAQHLSAIRAPGPVLFRLRVSDITDNAYRRKVYGRFRLLERLSIINQMRGQWIMLNLYRGRRSGPFRQNEIASIGEHSLLLASLAAKHTSLGVPDSPLSKPTQPTSYLDNLLGGINVDLTPRERAVCARALAGQTVQGIASELGVKSSTVATLRRRAYSRLNISSLNELFALCIAQLTRSRA